MPYSFIKTLLVFGLVLILGLSASCGDKNKKGEKYSITFELNGGVLNNAPTEYETDTKVTLPTPSKEGVTFG